MNRMIWQIPGGPKREVRLVADVGDNCRVTLTEDGTDHIADPRHLHYIPEDTVIETPLGTVTAKAPFERILTPSGVDLSPEYAGHEPGEEVDCTPGCPACHGEPTTLGGHWFRCRQCGLDFEIRTFLTPEEEL